MSLITHKLPVVLICLFIFAPFLRSQDSMPGAFAMYGDGKSPHNNSLKAIDSVVIDTSLLTIRYKASYWMYPGGTPTWHTAVLNVGASHSLFYNFSMHIRNRYSYIQLMKCDRLGPDHDVEMEEPMKESAHSFTALSCRLQKKSPQAAIWTIRPTWSPPLPANHTRPSLSSVL